MKRNASSPAKIQKIMAASRTLFIEKGYEETSVRDILKAADISTGSLYNFFTNKEEILLAVYREIIDQVHSTSEEATAELNDPLMRFSVSIALQAIIFLRNTSQVNIYRAAFKSQSVETHMISRWTKTLRPILANAALFFSDREIQIRVVALNAAVNAVLEKAIIGEIPLHDHEAYPLLIRTGLCLFDIPDQQIDAIVRKTVKLVA